MNKTFEFAKLYIRCGWPVHPLLEKSKKPATKRGFKDASKDPIQVSKWFQDSALNIGIVTGRDSGIAVIDVDPKNGGFESFERLKKEFSLDIDTLTVETGGGGLHLYFRINGNVKSRIGILPGIDIKADGGYIVAPPSIHPKGRAYTFRGDWVGMVGKLKIFPCEIIERLDQEGKKTPPKNAIRSDKILEGGRHNFLVSQMGEMRGLGLSKAEVGSRLHFKNSMVCDPPLERSEVDEIINFFKARSGEEILLYAPYTDLGNAERFKAYCADQAIYVEKMQKWYVFDGKRYVEDSGSKTIQLVKSMLRHSRDIGKGVYNDKGDELVKHLRKTESNSKIQALLTLAKTESPLDPKELDANPFLFNVANGTIDLQTGTLVPHSKHHRITKITSVAFDSSATCPKWRNFLQEVTGGSKEVQDYIQKVVGYCMTGVTKEQCFWILFGLGANGKSTFIDVLKKVLGEYGRSADISTFTYKQSENIRNDLARLFDARLVTSVEIQEGKLLDESVVKQVTGGDPVTCRFLFKEHFEYVPKWKLFMVVNHLPHINGTDHGIWRRIKCVPFLVQFTGEKIDRDLPSKLDLELPGILNWAVEGCLKWQKEGLDTPLEILAAGNEYRANEDYIEDFLNDHTEKGKDLRVGATPLFSRFVELQHRIGQRVMSQKQFAQKLEIKGFKKARGHEGRVFYLGLDLKPKPEWRP
jgi:putative DNA primase/helicase